MSYVVSLEKVACWLLYNISVTRQREPACNSPNEDKDTEIHCDHCQSTWAKRRGAAHLGGGKRDWVTATESLWMTNFPLSWEEEDVESWIQMSSLYREHPAKREAERTGGGVSAPTRYPFYWKIKGFCKENSF